MRKIIRNLLILIAVCIGIIYFTRRPEGFAPNAANYILSNADQKKLCVQNSGNLQLLPYLRKSLAKKGEKTLNRSLIDADIIKSNDYYCVSPEPLKYLKKDKDKILKEFKNKNSAACMGGMGMATFDTCTSFYSNNSTKLTAKEKRDGYMIEIPCIKCVKG